MRRLLEQASAISDKAELFSSKKVTNFVVFENGKLKDVDTKVQRGSSLRIIKDNKLGFAYTKNLRKRKALLENCKASLKGQVEANFNFPLTREYPKLRTYSVSLSALSNRDLVEECQRIGTFLKSKIKGQFNITAGDSIERLHIMNSTGTNIRMRTSQYVIVVSFVYPNSYAGLHRLFASKNFRQIQQKELLMMIDLYNRSSGTTKPNTKRMKVLFMPESMYTLTWRLQSATNGAAVYEKQSPLSDKIGEQLFSKELTIYNDPLNDNLPGARSVDDEATPCQHFPIVENGVLSNFYYDLYYAQKSKAKPSGHGFKTARWSGETIALKPSPSLQHLHIQPGKKTFRQLIENMDQGIVVGGALGAHSGNMINGDFSIGLSPGLYVKNGEVIGRVKDTMVAGNIYETMQKIIAIEDTIHITHDGVFPAILFDDVSVATSK
ncbi:MAG: metallopeptidase TldD-related protein [bacterium]